MLSLFMKVFETLFLLCLLLINWGKVTIHLSSNVLFSLGGSTWAPIFLIFVIFVSLKCVRKDYTFFISMKSPLFIFTLYCLLSVTWCNGRDLTFFIQYLLPSFLIFVMARSLLEEQPGFLSERLLPVMLIGPIIIVARGLIDSSGHLLTMGELDTPFEHHTLISMNFLFLVPLVIGRILLEEKRRILYATYLVLMILGVVICGSRVGLAGLFLVLLYVALSFANRQVKIIAAAALAVSVLFLFSFPQTHQRFVGLLSLGNDPYLITRTRIWDMTMSFTYEHILFGIGFSRKAFLALGGARFGDVAFFYEHPHNLYLQILSLLGIAGFAIFIWLCIDIGKKIFAICKSQDNAKIVMGRALSASFIGFLFTNLVEGSLNSCRMMMNLFIVLAMLDNLYRQCNDDEKVS